LMDKNTFSLQSSYKVPLKKDTQWLFRIETVTCLC
jgi:hypothetical protein